MLLGSEFAIAEVVFKRIGTRWFWGLVGGACLVLFLVASDTGPDPALQIIRNRDRAVGLISLIAILLTVVAAATEIPRDVTSRVLLIVLTKPLKRHQFVLGKFLGVLGLGLLFMGVCSLFTAGALWTQGLPPDGELVRSVAMGALRVSVVAAMALLFSTSLSEVPCISFTIIYTLLSYGIGLIAPLLKGSGLPAVAKIVLSLVLYIAPNLQRFAAPETFLGLWITGRLPAGGATAQAASGAAGAAGTATRFSLDALMRSVTPQWDQLGASILYALIYVSLLLALAVLAFRRRIVA